MNVRQNEHQQDIMFYTILDASSEFIITIIYSIGFESS